jgi:hypothetical protein
MTVRRHKRLYPFANSPTGWWFHVSVTARTLTEVRQLADQVADAADELRAAMTIALGSGWARVEDQLRQELGHEVRVDPGSADPDS